MNVELSELAVVGVDIGKDVFHLIEFDNDGTLGLRKKIKRLALVTTFEKFPCTIPAKYVKPFNKGQKNDYNDAEAIAEVALRPNMYWVSEKTQDQLDLKAMHWVQSRLVSMKRFMQFQRQPRHLVATVKRISSQLNPQ